MSSTLTIRAKALEGINPNTGHGFPHSVKLSGGKFLSYGAALEIGQEAVDTLYGEYASGWLATMNRDEWDKYQTNEVSEFTMKVVRI